MDQSGDGPASSFGGSAALVTGAGSGIGRAAALAFAAAGARVAVAGRDLGRLEETVALIEADGGTALAIATDITDEPAVEAMVARTVAELGGLDIAVNNAGTFAAGPLADLDRERWDTVIGTNLTGVWLCLKHEMRQMRGTGGGSIVNVASNVGAHLVRPGVAAYAAAKAGVSTLTRVAALEGIGDGIRVNALSPGASETPMSLRPGESEAERAERIAGSVPVGRLGRPDELAAAVLWLAGPGSGFAVGHDLVLDGGASL